MLMSILYIQNSQSKDDAGCNTDTQNTGSAARKETEAAGRASGGGNI